MYKLMKSIYVWFEDNKNNLPLGTPCLDHKLEHQ